MRINIEIYSLKMCRVRDFIVFSIKWNVFMKIFLRLMDLCREGYRMIVKGRSDGYFKEIIWIYKDYGSIYKVFIGWSYVEF